MINGKKDRLLIESVFFMPQTGIELLRISKNRTERGIVPPLMNLYGGQVTKAFSHPDETDLIELKNAASK